MHMIFKQVTSRCVSLGLYRNFSVTSTNHKSYTCKLLVVGGGTGGCTVASKFSRRLPKDSVIVLEPSPVHYYQPLWTLVGAGVKTVASTRRSAKSVLPSAATWLQDSAQSINPEKNVLTTKEGHDIHYEYIVIAAGLENDYDRVPGLLEGLNDKNSKVSTIFSPDYCEKVWEDLKAFKGGDAIFTFPNSPIKCPGAPQKIVYLAESHFCRTNIRAKSNIIFNTCLPVIFGVKKYADSLMKVVERKNIQVNYKTVLKEVYPDKKEAVFFNADQPKETSCVRYDMLHVSPPMRTARFLRGNSALADATGYLDVDKYTLQHVRHPNVYGLGDCTNTPNSKTAAAVTKQCYVLEHNLLSTMKKDSPKEKYDGYGACPLVTSYNTCILAEFLYDGVPWETMHCDQSKESVLAFYMKKDLFPFLYWHFMLKGYYHGPEFVRNILNPLGR